MSKQAEKINSSMIHKTGDTTAMTLSNPNDIKFGITTPFRESDKGGELVHLPHDKPIAFAVETVCKVWCYSNPSDYALKFSEPPSHYVTEERRKELSGKLVSMQFSPIKLCEEIMSKMKSNNDKEIVDGMAKLSRNASDPTVADVFVGIGGLPTLLDLMEKEKPIDWQKEGFAFALQALLDIMMLSNDATWDKVQSGVISRVAFYVNRPSSSPPPKLIGPALQVLENAIASGNAYAQIEKEVSLTTMKMHIQTSADSRVKQNALALINALLSKADLSKRKSLATTLGSPKFRDTIIEQFLKSPGDRSSETTHELYVMQTLLLNMLDEKRQTPVNVQQVHPYTFVSDDQDQGALFKIKELFRIAFESADSSGNYTAISFDTANTYAAKREKPNAKRDYQRLGFTNDSNPEMDFTVVPPGTLALDCMYHLATVHTENYNKIVLDGICRASGAECPFARSSISLVNVLSELLKMGEQPDEQNGTFYPFFFRHDKPFEELFCICSQLVTKTWKEMRATAEDFDKVFDVVREQIVRTLRKTPETFEVVRSLLNGMSYAEIMKIRQQERSSREEWELQAQPIQELRKKLEPEMIDLIKQNRINYLVTGTRFNKFTSRGLTLIRVREKFWFCRLSPNGKVFHYGECEEKATPLPEELPSKINVVDIKDLLTGKDCPHMKESKGKKSSGSLAFSLVTEKESFQTVDFVAPDKRTFDVWTDGINALLGKPMNSDAAKEDLETLLHMEIKLRLLEIEGLPELPQVAPPIPELPLSFDFSALQVNGK
ncbi:engulfment and cell motility protein 2 isoform X1 [Folsomia candida]|nr:engulfment and cell motility protein 2 isoform X1 [Folsomia candida]XP_021963850.1 engulfment and cell motility protein 2 isoform X1 [Folsomia candida]XP_035715280.1 engulfment and cell motility protein 2 isoform X1 [Folsomia candida]XP_035715281.1 engulfment and cell motility protein 2 isoform X1 [Folsomia candida]